MVIDHDNDSSLRCYADICPIHPCLQFCGGCYAFGSSPLLPYTCKTLYLLQVVLNITKFGLTFEQKCLLNLYVSSILWEG